MKILLLEDDGTLGPWLKKNLIKIGNSVDLFISILLNNLKSYIERYTYITIVVKI